MLPHFAAADFPARLPVLTPGSLKLTSAYERLALEQRRESTSGLVHRPRLPGGPLSLSLHILSYKMGSLEEMNIEVYTALSFPNLPSPWVHRLGQAFYLMCPAPFGLTFLLSHVNLLALKSLKSLHCTIPPNCFLFPTFLFA